MKIKVLDCTLRDGGFVNDFNWSKKFVEDYFKLTNDLPIEYIELGYWKQKNKSKNLFYNIDEDYLYSIKKNTNKKIAVIGDYHYQEKNLKNYPKKVDGILSLIRMTCRKENLEECIDFLEQLKDYTKLNVSLNVFNFSNYKSFELKKLLKIIKKTKIDYIYFADTHGSLDFFDLPNHYEKFISELNEINKNFGFHFHDNLGRAYSNFKNCFNRGFKSFDSTIYGIGRGGGNLRSEYIINKDLKIKILNFIQSNYKELYLIDNLHTQVTAINDTSNLYGGYAAKNKIKFEKLDKFCKSLNIESKNNFKKEIIEKKIK